MIDIDRAPATTCPIPLADYPQVLMAHGGGGTLMHKLIDRMIVPAFASPLAEAGHDGVTFCANGTRLAFTTDSHVVHPLFFPGGDIGTLAVNGTVNDLAMCGARPLYLSAGFILEEGMPMETLWRVVQSMRDAAQAAGVQVVTGDTKVVDRGKGDGIFINTAGIGIVEHDVVIEPRSVRPGDCVLISGDIGRHGIAIMAVRAGLEFETEILSDCAPLNGIVSSLLDAGVDIHCMRDLTRGGLASSLVEISRTAGVHIEVEEHSIKVSEEVQGACEMLGLDPMHVANEGRFIAFVAPEDAAQALEIMRAHPAGSEAAIIGRVVSAGRAEVTMRSLIGANRIVDMLSGEQLPRIC